MVKFAIVTGLLLLPGLAAATPPTPGGYASGFIGISVPQNTDIETFLSGDPRPFNDRVELDPGLNIGGTGGYDFGYIRVEGELSYKWSDIKSVTDKSNQTRFANVKGDVDAFAMMFNAFIDLHNASTITPYFGGGIGFASLGLGETTAIDRTNNNQQVILYDRNHDTVFAYQAGAGLELAFNRVYSLDLGYRYFATDTATLGDVFTPTSSSFKYVTHTGTLGFRVKF